MKTVNSNNPSSNPLLTTQISSQRLIRKTEDKDASDRRRSVLCYTGLSCCAAIGILIIALVIYNTVTTARLQDELREMRNRLDDWIMEELNDEDLETIMEVMASRNEDMDYKQPPDDDAKEKHLQRSARSLNESPHGIPMNDESYAVVRQRTNSPADAIVEDLLLNKPVTTRPTMVYDWRRRQKRFHSSGSHLNEIVHHSNSEHVQNRAGSWAMSTSTRDRSKAFRQVMTKSQYEHWQSQNPNHRPDSKRVPGIFHKSLETVRDHAPMEQHRVRTIIAVHYGAVQQRDVRIPPHVRNIDWQPSKWVNQLAMDRFFQMDNGAVRVRKSGLYQVYAQITFEQRSSPNGFIVAHNAERFLECQTSTQSSNSCYTSRVVYMESDDQILLSDMFADQRVVLHEGQSFFGLMKLGQVQDRSRTVE